MKEKLEIIRANENMNASELAKKLGVEASAISHIRSGRNKPSFDFVVKILAAFPHINPDWLLLNRGPYSRAEVSDAMVSADVVVNVAREDMLSPAGAWILKLSTLLADCQLIVIVVLPVITTDVPG